MLKLIFTCASDKLCIFVGFFFLCLPLPLLLSVLVEALISSGIFTPFGRQAALLWCVKLPRGGENTHVKGKQKQLSSEL